jgi:hypothetical protein
MNLRLAKFAKLASIAGAMVALSACNGGDDSSSTALTFTGTAATGKAIPGGTVVVTCKSGTGTATTLADGSYKVDVANGAGPCLVEVTKDGTTLRSVAPSAGVINVTPLTDMQVTYLATRAGTTPSQLAANLTSTTTNTTKAILADTTAIAGAASAVATTVKAATGVEVGTDFRTATLVANGTGADKVLDDLKAAGAVTSAGAPSTTIVSSVTTEAQKQPPYVAPTGS